MVTTTDDSATRVPAPPLRSPQYWLFQMFPLRQVIPVLLIANAIALLALVFGAPVYVAIACGVLIVLIALVPWRGTSLATFLADEFRFRRYASRRRSNGVDHAPFDVPVPDGGSYGMRWDGARLITMLRI